MNILICPLEWGLGHAARMIPLARRLQELNCRVFIGAGEKHLALFRAELPGLTYIDFPGFSPGYSRHLPQYVFMLFKTPLLLYHIVAEHHRVKKIIREHNINVVISDNRFGLWSNTVTSVYVTHILKIPLPPPLRMLERIGVILHGWIINKFTHCIIPDLPGDINLSGRLSHGLNLPANARYIGILSRFDNKESFSGEFSFRHNTLILSGPEPQRGILREKMVKIMGNKDIPCIVLEGRPDKVDIQTTGNIISYQHLLSSRMSELLSTSENIITRSGYTSVMDLVYLNRSALLIPTPGQTEQEYLADYMDEKGWFKSISQKKLSTPLVLPGIKPSWPVSMVEESRILLENFLRELLKEGEENEYHAQPAEKPPPDL